MDENLIAECEAYSKEYMDYLSVAKTERRAYAQAVALLERAGYREMSSFERLQPGDKVYRGYHGKTVMAAIVGKRPVAGGIRVVGGHTDAPRLDLKPRPIYEKDGVVYFDTHIYGGIKKYQWLVHPLAVYGTIVKKSGEKVDVAIGDGPDDPVFMISDLLPHLAHDLEQKKLKDFFPAEDLDVIASVGKKDELLRLVKERFGVEEGDFLSAELEVVPAGMPREVGMDRSLIAAYGHDDRVCAYAGLSALLKLDGTPEVTASIVMCDKEEIGSMGATGMQSSFFENTVAEMLVRQGGAGDIDVRRCLERSTMLSADVTAAADPHFGDVNSTGNEAKLKGGPALSKYTGGTSKSGASDARAEFVAYVRKFLDGDGVTWQMAELGRMEKGGGGTISQYMARFGMDVIDFGTPILNMHAPWELASKEDCYWTYRAYKAYFQS